MSLPYRISFVLLWLRMWDKKQGVESLFLKEKATGNLFPLWLSPLMYTEGACMRDRSESAPE